MNYGIIIMLVAIVLSIIYLLKYNNKFSITIVVLQSIAVVAALSGTILAFFSSYFFAIAILITCFYPVIYKKNFSTPKKRYLFWFFLFPLIIKFVFRILYLPGSNFIALSMLIPMSIFVYVLMNRKNWIYEIGFMITFFADALCRFIALQITP